ncbi:MAG: hypothetical protein M1118_12880 [Chloroflexi bacterium]|nr:hypothetical protein [Chloroflexota bacterium]
MASAALVGPDIAGGERLLEELRREGFSIFDAFWYFSAASGSWRLAVSTPEWDTLGPLGAYARAQQALLRVPQLKTPLKDIVLVRPTDRLIGDLRKALPDGVLIRPYTDTVILRESMEEDGEITTVYVYCLLPAPTRLGLSG